MSGTWPTARAAIKAQLDGLTFTLGADFEAETLTAFEFAVPGRQDAGNWPYCFVMPSPPVVERGPGRVRYETRDVRVRVMLAPQGQSDDLETLQRRYDGWIDVLVAAFDDAVKLDGNADVFLSQEFTDLALYDDVDKGWGFEMSLGQMRTSAVVTFSA